MVRRDERIIVKLTPDMKERLQRLCDEMGVSMSSFIAVTLGQVVRQAEIAEKAVREVLFGAVSRCSADVAGGTPAGEGTATPRCAGNG